MTGSPENAATQLHRDTLHSIPRNRPERHAPTQVMYPIFDETEPLPRITQTKLSDLLDAPPRRTGLRREKPRHRRKPDWKSVLWTVLIGTGIAMIVIVGVVFLLIAFWKAL